MSERVNVLLPIETINRELDGRLLLACAHASPRNRLVLGQHDAVFDAVIGSGMTGGVYVGKNLFRDIPLVETYERYGAVKARGFRLVHLHEEGAILEGGPDRWREVMVEQLLDPRQLAADDYVCTWGDFQRDFYRSLDPPCRDRIVTTGHPRFDILKPMYRAYFEEDVAALRRRFGRFVLINTAFSLANNSLGLADTFSARVTYDPALADRRDFIFGRVGFEMHLIAEFIKLANRLSLERPDITIVFRPHPAEDWNFYRTVFRGISNIEVVHEGPVTPWLLACELLVQNGCTTGIEAYLAGTPVINYKPYVDARRDMFLANLFGVECHSEEEVVRQVGQMLAAPERRCETRVDALGHGLMANFRADSMALFTAVLAEAEARQASQPQGWNPAAIRRTEQRRRAIDAAKAVVRPLFPAKQKLYLALRSHFPGFDRAAVLRKVGTIEQLLGKQVQVTFFSSDIMAIEAAA